MVPTVSHLLQREYIILLQSHEIPEPRTSGNNLFLRCNLRCNIPLPLLQTALQPSLPFSQTDRYHLHCHWWQGNTTLPPTEILQDPHIQLPTGSLFQQGESALVSDRHPPPNASKSPCPNPLFYNPRSHQNIPHGLVSFGYHLNCQHIPFQEAQPSHSEAESNAHKLLPATLPVFQFHFRPPLLWLIPAHRS